MRKLVRDLLLGATALAMSGCGPSMARGAIGISQALVPAGAAGTTSASKAHQGPWVLVSAFGPYDGVPENPSETIATSLKKAANPAQLEVVVCPTLPVRYGLAAESLWHCLHAEVAARQGRPPRLVLSLGAGALGLGQIRFETRAINAMEGDDHGLGDPRGAPIDTGLPRERPVGLSARAIRRAIPIDSAGLFYVAGRRLDAFVCNDLSWRFQTKIDQSAWRSMPFTFVHVPSNLQARQAAELLGRAVDGLLRGDLSPEPNTQASPVEP